MAVRTRIAFQGGGARLADLLPVVAALQKAKIAKEIAIGHVSGTSAGSIAAAMLATNTDAQQFITQLTNVRNKVVRKLLGKSRLFEWLSMSKASIISSILMGRAISSKKLLRKTLFDLFHDANPALKEDLKLKELRIDGFSATVTDITSCRGTRFSKSANGEAELFDVLADSCAVPFVFKSLRDLKSKPPDNYVDGGVIQNFPIDALLDDADSVSDMILGFGFSDDFKDIGVDSVWSYSGRLLSASMQSSMEYAKRKVGEDRVYEIKSDLDTFEFHEAIKQLLDAGHFERQRDAVYDWILRKVSTYRTSYERVTLSHVLNRVKNVYTTYVDAEASQNRSNLLKIIKVDSAFHEDSDQYSPNDRSFTFYDIGFKDRRINAVRIANPLDNLSYQFNDELVAVPEPRIQLLENSKALEFTSIPSRGTTRPDSLDHLVFFAGTTGGARTISIRQKAFIFNGLTGIRPDKGGTDYFVMRNQGVDPVDGATFIFYVPNRVGNNGAEVEVKAGDVRLSIRDGTKEGCQTKAGPGAQLTDAEITALPLPKEEGDSRFVRVGWRIEALPANSAFGLDLSLAGIEKQKQS